MKRTTEIQHLSCDLTEEEVGLTSNRLAGLVAERSRLIAADERAKADAKDSQKTREAEINGLWQQIAADSTMVRTRTAMRDVPCDWHIDLDRGRAVLVRRDTQEVLRVRPVTEEEKQLALGDEAVALSAEVTRALEVYERQCEAQERAAAEAEPEPPAE
jgi:hypothetical protein